MWERDTPEERELRLVRPYALTGGRTRSSEDLPIETLLVTTAKARQVDLTLERRRIARLCVQPRSIAEVSAELRVPVGVARVLAGDLAAEGLVEVHRPAFANQPDIHLLERVLDGLNAL